MKQQPKSQSFHEFMHELMADEPADLASPDLSLDEMIPLTNREGRTVRINVETWWYFLEVLPPRWMSGSAFAFAEGDDRFRLFWERSGQHFARQLTEEQSDRFCQLTGASRHH